MRVFVVVVVAAVFLVCSRCCCSCLLVCLGPGRGVAVVLFCFTFFGTVGQLSSLFISSIHPKAIHAITWSKAHCNHASCIH